MFNPSFARDALVSGEAEVADPDAHYAVETADGRRIPVATEVASVERALDNDMPAAEFKSIVGGLSQPTMFRRSVNRFEIAATADDRPQVNLFMSRAAFGDLDLEEFRRAIRTQIPDSGTVRIHATSAARCAFSFVAVISRSRGSAFIGWFAMTPLQSRRIQSPPERLRMSFFA